MIKPYKAPLTQRETDISVEPTQQDRVITLSLAQTTPTQNGS